MISRIGEPKQDVYMSGTYDGITVNALLFHSALNASISSADFKPEQVQVKVTLRRNNQTKVIMSDNLLVLGVYNTLRNGLHKFINGFDRVYPSNAAKAVTQRTVTLKFGGHIRVSQGDQLVIEVSPAIGSVSANLDTALTHFEFYANPSIGYESYTPATVSQVVQTNTSNQPFSLGDNVTRIAFLNFDKTTYENPVIGTMTLSSDKLDKQLTYAKILAHIANETTEDSAKRYGAAPPAESVYRLPDMLPQSFILFDGSFDGKDLDNVRIDSTFESANVNTSKNYMIWTQYEADKEQFKEAQQIAEKHTIENIQKKLS